MISHSGNALTVLFHAESRLLKFRQRSMRRRLTPSLMKAGGEEEGLAYTSHYKVSLVACIIRENTSGELT